MTATNKPVRTRGTVRGVNEHDRPDGGRCEYSGMLASHQYDLARCPGGCPASVAEDVWSPADVCALTGLSLTDWRARVLRGKAPEPDWRWFGVNLWRTSTLRPWAARRGLLL